MAVPCPLCDVGFLTEVLVNERMNYRGEDLVVADVAVSECDHCREQVVLPEQIRANERHFADAKRTRDGLLRSYEISGLRDELGLTQADASDMFGGGQNAFSKYERGEVIQSRAMDLLLRVAERVPEAAKFLSRRSGVSISSEAWVTVSEESSAVDSPASNVTPLRALTGLKWDCANDGQWRDEPVEVNYVR